MDQHQLSVKQFGDRAANYLTSSVHATGADLDRLAAVAAELKLARVLDLGCGAGHASFALACGGATRVTACDPSEDMLNVVRNEATARGHRAVETCVAAAEELPFEDRAFDCIVTRYSAHHWASVPRALAECFRVMVPGGRLIVIDLIAPERPLLDTSLQTIELLRDGSHVRSYRVSEWRSMFIAAGFPDPSADTWKRLLEFQSWVARIGTPLARVEALHEVFAAFPDEVRSYFQINADHDFHTDSAWIEAVRGAAAV